MFLFFVKWKYVKFSSGFINTASNMHFNAIYHAASIAQLTLVDDEGKFCKLIYTKRKNTNRRYNIIFYFFFVKQTHDQTAPKELLNFFFVFVSSFMFVIMCKIRVSRFGFFHGKISFCLEIHVYTEDW